MFVMVKLSSLFSIAFVMGFLEFQSPVLLVRPVHSRAGHLLEAPQEDPQEDPPVDHRVEDLDMRPGNFPADSQDILGMRRPGRVHCNCYPHCLFLGLGFRWLI